MPDETTQPSLLCRLQDPANQAAWREFDVKYGELILRYCYRRGLQTSDAEDVRQDVLLSMSKALPAFEYRPELGRFRDYLGTVVRNSVYRCTHARRREIRGLDTHAARDLPARDGEALDRIWEEQWVLHHYRLALESLRGSFDPRSVEIFQRILEGEPVDRIAAEFATNRNAVYKIKQRVRDRLRALIERQILEERLPQSSSPRSSPAALSDAQGRGQGT